jgi:hypothetical protein
LVLVSTRGAGVVEPGAFVRAAAPVGEPFLEAIAGLIMQFPPSRSQFSGRHLT